jgi:hypothetical protein
MKKHVALSLLALTVSGVIGSHLAVEARDDSYLLQVDGVAVDVRGQISAAWNQATRQCEAVAQNRDLTRDPSAMAVQKLISDFSPPDSRRLRLRQLSSSGPWLLAEVEFVALQPAVILLEQKETALTIHSHALWSGTTQPWLAGPWIRRYLRQRAPQVVPALWDCFDPSPGLFDGR